MKRAGSFWAALLAVLVVGGCGGSWPTAAKAEPSHGDPGMEPPPGASDAEQREAAPAGGAAAAGDDNPHVWKPQIRSVAVFKNGLGFFMREGKVVPRNGWCMAAEVPPATFGTLAIYAKSEQQTVDIVGSGPGEVVAFDDRDAPNDPAAKRARLEASKNLKVHLHYRHKGQERTAAGKLVSVGPEFAVLDDETTSFAVPLEGITKMQVLDLPLRIHVTDEQGARPEQTTLGMAYLRKGITWIPDYTLEILDEDTAELTLRGTLVNEAEDLIHSDVHLVVGVPHFVHTDYMAPIAVGQVIRTIGAAVASQAVPQQVTTQIMNRAAIVAHSARGVPGGQAGGQPAEPVERPVEAGGDLREVFSRLPQMESAAASDYTVYTQKDLTLRRGEKAIITLFTARIKYSHIYRWSLPKPIEHSLLLHNNTDTPWTIGPCLILSGDRPLGEDLLRYVPKGGRGELPVTTAINVAHEKVEREISRKLKAHSPSHNLYYDLVVLEGELRFHNYENRAVEIHVNNPIPGKPTQVDLKGSISINPQKLRLLEREGSASWRLTLEPGEQKTVTYQYERYVPSR